MIKAIFFDIDGTLLSHNKKQVSKEVKTALKVLQQQDIKIFVATGRHHMELKEMPLKGLDFNGYITLNGQYCYDNNGLIYDLAINRDDVTYLLQQFEKNLLPIRIIEENRMYINFINDNVKFAQEAISTALPEISTRKNESKIYQVIVYENKQNVTDLLGNLIDCKATSWHEFAIDIIPKSGGKQNGIKQVLAKLNIKKEETMAFGDGENDMDMLKSVGIGVAMGNATNHLKQIADYVTDSVENDGIVKALKYYKIL